MKTMMIYALSLIAMLLSAIVVMNILNAIFHLNYHNISTLGCKVGFLAWLVLLIIDICNKHYTRSKQ